MKPAELAATPVGSWLLRFVDPDPGRIVAAEACLYRAVSDAAVCVTSLGIRAALGIEAPVDRGRPLGDTELELAEVVLASDAARWWTAGWHERPQIWLASNDSPPAEGTPGRRELGRPPTALWTSSAVSGLPSAFWPVLEGRAGRWTAWEITVKPGLRVFELRSPDDWRWLCHRFGTTADKTGLFFVPDWHAMMTEFDGVHLTTEGLIRLQGVPIAHPRGPTMLWEWDAESTAWFRWPVLTATRLGPVC